ncbi:MAG: hypothetical protein A3I92_02070 [Candidatus Yanofskybacteria bacterium RIFCSPLOWO2_02_FULL_43_10b]|uniref:Transglutaminase-like domain-containing protein n=1 Tax=Candidatus Yanofskybacteria bacterium RIFCSPLOWO2_02_FULL_43_10b TaxID=1802704 RepID=A0A1F8H0G1_9BACT|nr:MAG: hypothetical protein A3I92_02070 [Candidatus Yanofskybacteria bacterium RIFCSPLOWO2_02_FULL_43_10b]
MDLFQGLTKEEIKVFKKLSSPRKIQDFLNSIPANFEKDGDTLMSPCKMIRENKAHCMEGALLAAAVLWFHGQKPLLMDLKTNESDFDHVVALFQRQGRWGAISKTNHAVLRYREPVYDTPRELAMSYFHEYFLDNGSKTLRSYSAPFDLSTYKVEPCMWITAEEDLWKVSDLLDDSPHYPILDKKMIPALRRADPIEIKAGKLTEWDR